MGARDVRAGSAYVEVMTKDSTDKGLSGIKAKLGKFGAGIAKIGSIKIGPQNLNLGGVGGAATSLAAAAGPAGIAVAAVAGSVAALTIKAANAGAAIQDLSNRYGISTDAVQALMYAAEESGTSIETLITGIKKMQQGLGGGTLGQELAALGLTMEQLRGLSPEQQLAAVANAFGNIANQELKMSLATSIFGRAGAELVPLLNGGAEGAEALIEAYKKLDITMSAEAVAEAEAMEAELKRLGMRFDALVVKIGGTLMPALEFVVNLLNKIPKFVKNLLPAETTGGQAPAAMPQQPTMTQGGTPLDNWLGKMINRGFEYARGQDVNQHAIENKLPGVLDIFNNVLKEMDRIGRHADRQANKLRIREARAIEADLKDVNKQIGDQMNKSISFSSFDKRDLLGGVFNDVQNSQLKELREVKKLMEKQLEKLGQLKPGLPVG